MNELDIVSVFTGAGGLDLGLERAGHNVRVQCEVDPYRRRILARHWPGVRCFADVREVSAESLRGIVDGGIDLLVGGVPCQGFSVAGERRMLADDRSGLFFEFARLADELVRPGGWLLFENVPGLLSGCSCVGCLHCRELLRLHRRGWNSMGRRPRRDGGGQLSIEGTPDSADGGRSTGRCPCRRCNEARRLLDEHNGTEFAVVRSVLGNLGFHDLAWRVLDSRYLGVPQRRRRIFLLARRARGRRAAEVLLEPEGGGGNFEAGREESQRVAASLARGSSGSGGPRVGAEEDAGGHLVAGTLDRARGGADENDAASGNLVAGTLTRRYGKGTDSDATDTFVGPDVASPITRGSSRPGISDPGRRQEDDFNIVATLRSHPRPSSTAPGAIAHTLTAEGFDASEDGTGRGTPLVCHPQGPEGEGRRGPGSRGDAGSDGDLREPESRDPRDALHEAADDRRGQAGAGVPDNQTSGNGEATDPDRVREAAGLPGGMDVGAFNLRGREDGAQAEPSDLASLRAADGGSSRSYIYGDGGMNDRCAFDPQPDGPRYAACGDAVTVNVAQWIGERLARFG